MSKKRNIGDWIIFTERFWTKPEVHRIAALLGERMNLMPGLFPDISVTNVLRHVVCSAMSRAFVTVNRHADEIGEDSQDAVLTGIVTPDYLDVVAELPGLQAAMEAVGWVVRDKAKHTLTFPNYLKFNHLVKGASRRGRPGDKDSAEAKRKREERARKKEAPLAKPLGQMPDNGATIRVTNPPERESEAEIEASKSKPKIPDAVDPSAEMDTLKRRVDALRPESWERVRHWNHLDEEALMHAAPGLRMMIARDWELLGWFFTFCAAPANSERWPDETRITSKRSVFLNDLSANMARAQNLHRSAGRPAFSKTSEPSLKKAEPKTVQDVGFVSQEEATAHLRAALYGEGQAV